LVERVELIPRSGMARAPTCDEFDLLEPTYLPLRQGCFQLYLTLPFQPFRRRDPAILAQTISVSSGNRQQNAY